MRTAVVDTSIAAYHAHHRSGKLNYQHLEIMGFIKAGRDYSLTEVARGLGWEKSTVSARVNELVALDRLVRPPGYTRRCSITRKTIHPFRLPIVQRELFT